MKDLLAIDIGSNTMKSLRMSAKDGVLVEGDVLSLPIRITKASGLVDDAVEKISYAIKCFMDSQLGDFDVRAVATSALRTCANSKEICQKVFANTGVEIEVISGEKEARLSALGAIYDRSIKIPDEFVFMDLGGGSLELAFCRNSKIEKLASLPIGAVRLTEMFIENPSAKIPQKALFEMRDYAKSELEKVLINNTKPVSVGTGGAIAAAKYMLAHLGLKNFDESLSLADLEYLLAKISQENVEMRIKNYAIPENRADIIPASFVCLITCMQVFSLKEMLYVNQSLRRGICVEHFNMP